MHIFSRRFANIAPITVLILPLLVNPFGYMGFELPKVLGLYLFTTLLLAMFLTQGYRLRLQNNYMLPYVFFAWLTICSVLGVSFWQSFFGSYFRMQGLITWFCYMVFFTSATAFGREEHFKRELSWAIFTSATIVSMLTIVQFLTNILFHTSFLLYDNRVVSTFGQPNFLGSFLVMAIPFAWYLLTQTKTLHLLLWCGLVINVLSILLTFSRGSILALVILLVLWSYKSITRIFFAIIVPVIGVCALFYFFPSVLYQQMHRLQVDLLQVWTAENRSLIAKRSVELASKRFVIGWGAESFAYVFPSVVKPQDFGLGDISVDSAHNIFVDIAVSSGIAGLGIFLAYLFVLFKKIFLLYKDHLYSDKNWLRTVFAVVIMFLITHQFSVISVVPMLLFWTVSGTVFNAIVVPGTNSNINKNVRYVLAGLLLFVTTVFVIVVLQADIFWHRYIY